MVCFKRPVGAFVVACAISLASLFTGFAGARADNFTGAYVGGNIGYSWGTADFGGTTVGRVSQDFPLPTLVFPETTSGPLSLSPRGGVWGVQAGRTWRTNPNWLAGVETDFQWTGQTDSGAVGFGFPINPSFCDNGNTCSAANRTDMTAKLKWFGTTRMRAGWEFDNHWVYGTVGFAYGKLDVSGVNTLALTDTAFGIITTTYRTPFNVSRYLFGLALGAGIEGVLPNNDWTWKVEYLYLNMSAGAGSSNISGLPTLAINVGEVTDHILRVGINYRFAGGNR